MKGRLEFHAEASFEQIDNAVRQAIQKTMPATDDEDGMMHFYIADLYSNHVIYEVAGVLYRRYFTMLEDKVEWTTAPEPVRRVVEYVSLVVPASKMVVGADGRIRLE